MESIMPRIARPEKKKGKEWIRTYQKADRLTKIAMLSHALVVHHIEIISYGQLSYLYDHRYPKYMELLHKVEQKEREVDVRYEKDEKEN